MVAGKIVAGRLVKLACRRHLDDLENGHKRGLAWHPERAERVFKFFENFLRIEMKDPATGWVESKPFILSPWECFVAGCLFGWLGADGFRRFRMAYTETAKGSGKTPFAAGLGIYGLVGDGEPSAEVYSAAPFKDQAGYLFNIAKGMVEGSPALKSRLKILAGSLVDHKTRSFFRAVSSEHRGLDGKLPHMALIDEVHEHPSSIVIDKMRAGTKGRRQALIFEITNSGYNRHSVCWDHHETSRQVLEKAIENDSWFAFVCGLDEGDDWKHDPKCWAKANPNLGVTIQPKYLEEQVREAVQIPAKENICARLNFCVWTEQSTRAIVMDDWHACKREFKPEDLFEQECFGGLDLSATTDLTAHVLVFPCQQEIKRDGQKETQRIYRVLAHFWLPELRVDFLENRDRVPYRLWAQQGCLTLTPGNMVDYEFVRARVLEDHSRFRIIEEGYDPWNARETAGRLAAEGVPMVEMRQGVPTLGEATKQLLALILDRRLFHNGHPILTWNASNLALRQDAHGGVCPDKQKSTQKIDGMVGLIEGLARAMLRGSEKRSVYEDRGVLVI